MPTTRVKMLRSVILETMTLARGDSPTVDTGLAALWLEQGAAEAWTEPDGLPGAAVDDLTNAEEYVLFTPNEGGDTVDAFVSTKVTFNPSTGKVTAGGLKGDVEGDVDGNVEGDLDGDVERAAPAAGVSTQEGVALNLEASAATAGTTNAGAKAGGGVTIKGGAAARKTSGDANGGSVTLTPGAGIGTGATGAIELAGKTVVSGDAKATSFTLADLNTAPATAGAAGVKGEIRFAVDALYLCIATNTWIRVALATWGE